MASNLPVFRSLPVHSDTGTIGPRWEKYMKRLEILFIALNITSVDRKKALLLHFGGEDVLDIFETLSEIVYEGDPDPPKTCYD